MKARFGSNNAWRNPTPGVIETSSIDASAVWRVAETPSATTTSIPSTRVKSSRSESAIKSMMSPSRASWAVMLFDSVTNVSASSALRPRCSASFRIVAAASSSTLRASVTPPIPTGVEAPTLVAGAMAAT